MFWARSICSRPADARASNASSMPRVADPATGRRRHCPPARTHRWSHCHRTRPRNSPQSCICVLTPKCTGYRRSRSRLGSVYGPRQNPHGDSGVVAVFASALLAGHPVTIYGDGTAVRDYVYVDDVVDAFICAAQLPPEVMGTYNIGTGAQTTVSDVYRLIAAALGVSSPPRYAAARTGEVHAIALDSKEAREDLGWKPSIKLADGIQRTIHWLRGTLETRAGRPRRCVKVGAVTPESAPRPTARSRRRGSVR